MLRNHVWYSQIFRSLRTLWKKGRRNGGGGGGGGGRGGGGGGGGGAAGMIMFHAHADT